jgi:membrane-bound inhibitor of C-type lysozyme
MGATLPASGRSRYRPRVPDPNRRLLLVILVGPIAALVIGTLAALLVPPARPSARISYRCDDGSGIVATFIAGDPGSASVERAGHTSNLPQVVAASGAHYTNGKVTFSIKANEATLTLPGTTLHCTAEE